MKNKKGITLIALIITIIVLLILAGITISMVLGENGLFNKSKNAVGAYGNAQKDENSMLSNVEAEMDKYLNGGSTGTPITSAINATNAASHIGEYIDLGTNLITKTETIKADWRIFDADETGVYAILADYLPNTTAGFPNTMKVSESTGAKEVTISKNANGWTIGWPKGDGANQCADNTEAVGILTTANNWNFLVPATSPLRGKITGGPSYQQFAKSWNKVNSSVQTMNETTPTSYSSLTDSTGMYLLTDTKNYTVGGNWLASPSMVNTLSASVWEVDGYGACINGSLFFSVDNNCGLRPLVHLTSDIKITGQDANGVWQIEQ